jgi:hypothetical protein
VTKAIADALAAAQVSTLRYDMVASAPVGGLVYLFLGKDRGRGSAVPE